MTFVRQVRNFVDRTIVRARAYRFDGEQANHQAQLSERRVSLSMMEGADLDNPDQARMASEIEHDSEERLIVLLKKTRLTLEEKRERDAIQSSLAARRQGFVLRTQQDTPTRFLGPLAANPILALLSSPAAWVALAFALPAGWGVWNHVRAGILERSLEAKEAELEVTRRQAAEAATQRDMLAEAVTAADAQTRQSAETIEAERRRRQRAEAEARRIQREMEQARAGNSVDYGFGGVRNDQPPSGAAGADHSNTAGGGAR